MTFAQVAVALVFIWIGINFWLLFANNLFFRFFGLQSDSWWQTLIAALIITAIFWIYLSILPPTDRSEIEDRFS